MSGTIRIRAVLSWAVFIGALGVLLLAGAQTLKPGFAGIPWNHVIVAGDSMLPAFDDGDLVVTRRRDTYAQGTVVAYRVPIEGSRDPLVIHRIVAGDARRGYIFKGDNRTTRDPWQVKPEYVLGEATLRVPNAGLVFTFLREPAGFAAFAALVSLFFFMRRDGKTEEAHSTDGSDAYAARKRATRPSAARERHQLQPWTERTPTRSRAAAQTAKPSSSTSKKRPPGPSSDPPRRKRSLPNAISRTGHSTTSESASGATAKPRTWRARRKLPALPSPRAPR